jgi:ElaB/YqjD/DUF883 family membrane-anchored ribosome-binding protein
VENTTAGVTATVEPKSTGELQQDMVQTREAITEKVTALENQVLGTFQTAADTVTNTVDAVKEAVTDAPAAVRETVKQTVAAVKDSIGSISVGGCVRERPWTSMGATIFAGFLIGYRTAREPRGRTRPVPAAAPAPAPAVAATRPSEPGLFSNLIAKVEGNVLRLVEDAMNTAFESLQRSLSSHVPEVVESAVQHQAETHLNGRPAAERPCSVAG